MIIIPRPVREIKFAKIICIRDEKQKKKNTETSYSIVINIFIDLTFFFFFEKVQSMLS